MTKFKRDEALFVSQKMRLQVDGFAGKEKSWWDSYLFYGTPKVGYEVECFKGKFKKVE